MNKNFFGIREKDSDMISNYKGHSGGRQYRFLGKKIVREQMFEIIKSGDNLRFHKLDQFKEHLLIIESHDLKEERENKIKDTALLNRIIRNGGFYNYAQKLEGA